MLYCFVEEDLSTLPRTDELWIQKRYAEAYGACATLSVLRGVDLDKLEIAKSVGEPVFLRSTCKTAHDAINLITAYGCKLVETADDIKRIQHWPSLGLTKRDLVELTIDLAKPAEIIDSLPRSLLDSTNRLFIKTSEKGISIDVSIRDLLSNPEIVTSFFSVAIGNSEVDIIASQYVNLAVDALGTCEVRFFVFDGVIRNCSRYVRMLSHRVDSEMIKFGEELALRVSDAIWFPKNYVMDIGQCTDGSFDLIEMNPITMSLCYSNNSVFIDHAQKESVSKGFGNEFLYDIELYPDDYLDPIGQDFGSVYSGDNHYSL